MITLQGPLVPFQTLERPQLGGALAQERWLPSHTPHSAQASPTLFFFLHSPSSLQAPLTFLF